MKKIIYGVIGSGWRAEFYFRIAETLPEIFKVCGVVSRREIKRNEIRQKWGIVTYSSIDCLLAENNSEFIVISVASCLKKMYNDVKEGIDFYGLAEACQDQYLALKIKEALITKEMIKTETQVWSQSGGVK